MGLQVLKFFAWAVQAVFCCPLAPEVSVEVLVGTDGLKID